MSTLTTAILAWFLTFAGADTTELCGADPSLPAQSCPAGSPPPDASTGSTSKGASPLNLSGAKPGTRPAKGDGIYNGI